MKFKIAHQLAQYGLKVILSSHAYDPSSFEMHSAVATLPKHQGGQNSS